MALKMHFFGRAIIKGLMQSLKIVKVKIALKALASFSRAVVVMQVNFFILDRAPQAFSKNVVHGPTPAIHADLNFDIQKFLDILRAGKVAALVAIPDFRAAKVQRLVRQKAFPAFDPTARQPRSG